MHRNVSAGTLAVQLFALAAAFGLAWSASRLVLHPHGLVDVVTPLGLFLLAGTLAAQILEGLRVPHLTAYLLVGIASGPHALRLVSHAGVESLKPVNGIALALIAFGGGAELRVADLRKSVRTLAAATFTQCFAVLAGAALLFGLLSPFVPFARLGAAGVVGVSLMWGVIAITRSPSAVLGILEQTRARGAVAEFTLAYVMLSDLVVLVLAASVVTLVRPLVEAGGALSSTAFAQLGQEVLGSISLGTTLGLLTIVYLRLVHRQLVLVLLALGFGFTQVIDYLRFEPLLTFLVAGFLVQNLSRHGDELAHEIEDLGSVVYVLFFAIAGAELDLPLLSRLWPIAGALVVGRVGLTFAAHRLSGRIARDTPVLRQWGWTGLVSQAGIAIGIGAGVERAYPRLGGGFLALTIATVAMNEMMGPVIFKATLDRIGESSTSPEPSRVSLGPPP